MNNKLYLMTAILAFASVGALLSQPTLMASAQPKAKTSDSPFAAIEGKTSASSTSSTSSDNIPLGSLSCGQVVKQSVKLSSNLDCTTGDGLIIGADGITLDLNGHTITGGGPNTGKIGVQFAQSSGVTLVGPGTIDNWQVGALVAGGQDDIIQKVQFEANQIAAFTTGATGTTISKNMMSDNQIGSASHSSSGTTFELNILDNNKMAGYTSVNSGKGDINTNTIENSDNGMFLDAQSTNNKVTSNTVLKNTLDINNANGLPTNVNSNTFTGNMCTTSVPDGLCSNSQ